MLIVLFSDLAPIPIANFLAHPGGPVSRFLTPIITYASGTSDLHRVAAISGYYFFAVYTLSTGISINGAIIGNPEGHRNGGESYLRQLKIQFQHLTSRTAHRKASSEGISSSSDGSSRQPIGVLSGYVKHYFLNYSLN